MTLRRHAASYAVIGIVQWLVEYGLMLALSEWVMPVEPANVIGRLAGACLGFWLNGKWTFAGDDTHVGRQPQRQTENPHSPATPAGFTSHRRLPFGSRSQSP